MYTAGLVPVLSFLTHLRRKRLPYVFVHVHLVSTRSIKYGCTHAASLGASARLEYKQPLAVHLFKQSFFVFQPGHWACVLKTSIVCSEYSEHTCIVLSGSLSLILGEISPDSDLSSKNDRGNRGATSSPQRSAAAAKFLARLSFCATTKREVDSAIHINKFLRYVA